MKRPSFVYVVEGTTGEYDDRASWLVVAYADKDLADKHAAEAERRAREYEHQSPRYGRDQDQLRAALGAYDPEAQTQYTGTDYSVLEVPLRTALP